MSSDAEDLRQQIAELKERIARLEARFDAEQQAPSASQAQIQTPRPREPLPLPSPAAPVWPPSQTPPAPFAYAEPERSLESRIGSQLFNRVGIVAVLIGVAWFLKLAIDNGWIGPAGRVIAGLIAGAGLVALSERFRATGYSAFSYSLKAIATGVLYLSLWAAFSLFHLINAEVAFLAMVMVTAFNGLMCWMQNSEILAFYAAIGGFITPILLSIHASNELTLFGYLLVLDVAVVAIIALRPWTRLLIASFAGTTFYAVGWYASDYSEEKFGLTLVFILAFFLVFAISPQLLRSLRLSTASATRPIEDSVALRLLPAVNAALGFAEVFLLMSNFGHRGLRPWIALPFAAFYLLMLRVTGWRAPEGTAAPLPATYLTLTVAFLTIAIPMAAHGRWIAVGWFLEFAILLWLAAEKQLRLLRMLGAYVLSLGILALLLPLDSFNPPVASTALFNPRFATYLWAIGACVFAARLSVLKSSEDVPGHTGITEWRSLAGVAGLTASVLLMIAVCLEIHAYWSRFAAGGSIDEQFSYSAWMMFFGAALLAAGFWRKSAFLRWQALVLLALSIAKVFLFDTRQLSQGYRIFSFLGLGALLLAVSFVYQKDWLNLRGQNSKSV